MLQVKTLDLGSHLIGTKPHHPHGREVYDVQRIAEKTCVGVEFHQLVVHRPLPVCEPEFPGNKQTVECKNHTRMPPSRVNNTTSSSSNVLGNGPVICTLIGEVSQRSFRNRLT